ncbi:hypothetical protein TTHERM_00578670 (macronuclear) [Tetrahymena thermophila SB210]|uniref:Uncharacterized protein n=1 Tax=Tetrahymena thermophila (strain SB210) TaxID=312017 RepID=I7LWP9_TETTS|nr:hypothetical protein TTHERM_00578670 [Tetrahymena thermophila SB210]EAS02623.3 hypothetical protein TTHERM_00578670 [Tetrahymena thermophila SB210]|eukprot:XP_001022868.3 hypothetical protein TTHERM_00578670 [Tetrahymena thermophila SB210]
MSYNNISNIISARQQVEALVKKNTDMNDKNYENSQKIRNQNTPNVRNLRNQMANIIIDPSNNHSPIKTNNSYNNQNPALVCRISTPSPIKFVQEDYQENEDKSGQSKSQIFYQDYFNNNINQIKHQSKGSNFQQTNNQVQKSQIYKNQEEQNTTQQPTPIYQQRMSVQNGIYQISQQPQVPSIINYQQTTENINERRQQQGNNYNNSISPKFANISIQPALQNQQNNQRLATMSGQQHQVKQYYQQQQQLTPQKSLNQLNTSQMQPNQTAPPKFAQFSPIFSQKQIVNYHPINMQPIFAQKNNTLLQQNNQIQVPPPLNISDQLKDQMIYPNLANQTPQAQVFQGQIIPQQLPLESVRKSLRSISVNQDAFQNQIIQINQNPAYQKVSQIQNFQQNYQKPVILVSQPQQQFNNQILQQPLQREQLIQIDQPRFQQMNTVYQDQLNRAQISNRSISIDHNITQNNQQFQATPNINQKSALLIQSNNQLQQQQQQQQQQQNIVQETIPRIQLNNINNSMNKNGRSEIKIQINGKTETLLNIQNEQKINSQKKQPLQNSNIQQGNIIPNNFRVQTEVTPEKKKNDSQYFRASLNKFNLQNSMQKQQIDENEIQNISEKKLAQIKDFSKSPSRFFAHVKEQLNKVKKQSKYIQNPLASFNDQSLRKIEMQSSSINKTALQQSKQQHEINNSLSEDSKQISQSEIMKDNSYSKNFIEIQGLQNKQKSQISSLSQLERSKQQIQIIKERIAAISKNSTDESPFQQISNEEQQEIIQNENKDQSEQKKESYNQKIQKNQFQLLINAAEYSLELDTDYSPIVDGKKVHLNIFKNNSKIQDSTESLQAQLK